MIFVCKLVLVCYMTSPRFRNALAYALSRCQNQCFKKLAPAYIDTMQKPRLGKSEDGNLMHSK